MPIVMQRMIDVISAADAVLETYREKRELIERIWQNDIAPGGRISIANTIASDPNAGVPELRKAMKMWYDVVEGYVDQMKTIEFPVQALLTLERERTHFKYNKRKNELSASAVRTHRARKDSNSALRASGIEPITGRDNMPSLQKTQAERDRDAEEGRLRAEEYMRNKEKQRVENTKREAERDLPVQSTTYTREDYEHDRDIRLAQPATGIVIKRSADENTG